MTMGEVLEWLRSKGIKITPQRQEVIRVLAESKGSHSAEEILKKVQDRYSNMSLDTIYRTLSLFREQGLVNEVHFPGACRRFELNSEENHRHHLICLLCGKTEEFPCCPEDCLARVSECSPGFKVSGHTFKIYGYCQRCQ
ncbi:MAG: Fur family transcriptional regulator [Bacillota bacterium]